MPLSEQEEFELLKLERERVRSTDAPKMSMLPDMKQSLREEAAAQGPAASALAGVGTAVNDAAMRLKQWVMGNKSLTPQETADVQAGRQLREVSTPALLGGIGGNIAMTYPIAPASLVGNIAAGGAIGAVTQPVLEGESPMKEVGAGMIGGGLGYGAGQALSRIIQPIRQSADVQTLLREGVVPPPGRAAGGLLRDAEEKLQSVPLVGNAIQAGARRSFEEVNQAAIQRAAPTVAEVGRDGVQNMHRTLANEYDQVLSRMSVTPDQQFLQQARAIAGRPGFLNAEQRAQFREFFDSTVNADIAASTRPPVLTGQEAKAIDSNISSSARGYMRSSTEAERRLGRAYEELSVAWKDLIRRNAPDRATSDALTDLDRRWAYSVIIDHAAAGARDKSGVFTPAELERAIKRADPSLRKRAFAEGSARMQELGDPAQRVLGASVPDSGTPGRALAASMLSLGGAGQAAAHYFGAPAYLAAAGLSPLMYSRAGSRYMLGDLIPGQQAASAFVSGLSPYAAQGLRGYALEKR